MNMTTTLSAQPHRVWPFVLPALAAAVIAIEHVNRVRSGPINTGPAGLPRKHR
jgi:hypothetical protein